MSGSAGQAIYGPSGHPSPKRFSMGGARRATNDQVKAEYEGTVATYRQTVLTAFQAVEDQLSTLRILAQEIGEQHTAVASANHYLDLSMVRYRGGVDDYLTVIPRPERTADQSAGRVAG